MKPVFYNFRNCLGMSILLLVWAGSVLRVPANPTGFSVPQGQGAATFSSSGSQVTINQTSPYAFINWQTFNIAAGETTIFNQPSATSVTWNYINDPNASSINGNINAAGYVILQNPNGFSVGGQAAITAHGLVMTTASTPALNLASGGPWSFNAPPPTAKIINYGQINISGGGSAFLIANDIENNGTISAPGGKIGLYAGQTVLISMSPDGRGLSAQVTLPQGSVDNEGNLIADAGSIVAHAQIINQNGLVQANSAQSINGSIELVASGGQSSMTLGNNSVISAQGVPSTSPSPGGFVVLKSDNTFTEAANSTINVAGGTGTSGGQNGIVEILCPSANVQPSGSYYAYLINPDDIYLSSSATTATTQPADNLHLNRYANLNVSDLAAYSQIDLQVLNNIELSSLLNLAPDSGLFNPSTGVFNTVALSAGNTITIDPGSGITVDAGAIALNATTVNQNGTLQANSFLNTGGNIEIDAANAVNLGANSVIMANGDAGDAAAGGSVTIQSGTLTFDNGSEIMADAGKIALNAATVNLNGTLQANPIQNASGAIEVDASDTLNLSSGSLLEANAGKIALTAATVNQNGTLQANSINNANGAIEINASAAVNLGASSIISANGDSTASTASSGGSVTVQSDNSFSDQSGSTINVSGASQGGGGGQVTISAQQMSAINSSINGQAGSGYSDASLSINTADITLNTGTPVAGQLALNVNSLSSGFSQINLQAANNIEVSSLWNLASKTGIYGVLSLLAGNTITVDNGAGIEADAGRIAMRAATVNLNGTLQANSAGAVNGAIEVEAGSSLNLGASSVISAIGQPGLSTPSPGGFVVLKADNSFSDTAGSQINIAGGTGTGGGQNGIIEIFGNGVTANSLQSSYDGNPFALFINPNNLTLSTSGTSASSQNLYVNDLLAYSQICLYNIVLNAQWNLSAANVNLVAGNNITLNSGSGIQAVNNWNVNMTAGTLPSGSAPTPGNDGIYLNGSAYLQTANGNINLYAANEVIVNSGAIRTESGGNIDVTAQYGDVKTGTSANGFKYITSAPWYTPLSSLGGISTVAGGNVTINAGGDVISFPTTTEAVGDPGTGAFSPMVPGNVTINAGGNVYGCYVVMDGTGAINAQNIGALSSPGTIFDNVTLSLAKGSWNLNAQDNIYLQEVRNPNGVFNNVRSGSGNVTPGDDLFDYGSQASVSLTAGNGVYITGNELPRPDDPVPMLLPPIVIINAGHGGVVLDTPSENPNDFVALSYYNITLYPSAYQNLQITTTDGGGFDSGNADGSPTSLLMSDSGQKQGFISNAGTQPFGPTDHANGNPAEINNTDPVLLDISGSIENLTLQVSKFAQINVGSDTVGFTFCGENLQATGPASTTSITVGGQIFDAGSFNFVTLDTVFPSLPAADFQPVSALPPGISLGSWYLPLGVALDTSKLPAGSLIGVSQNQLATDINNARMFTDISLIGGNLVYDPNTKTLTAIGPVQSDFLSALQTPTITVVRYGANGQPLLDLNQTIIVNGQPQPNPDYGHLLTDTIPWTQANSANYTEIANLNSESLGATSLTSNNGGLIVGGTGTFDVNANSISLGNSFGILSVGSGSVSGLGRDYSFLAPFITSGASINVTAAYLETPSSVIAALGGGNVNVTGTGEIPNSPLNSHDVGVSMDLGSQELAPFLASVMHQTGIALGIYTSGGGDVNVTGLGTINIDSSRIGTFNGGDVSVTSDTGDVNAGSGGSTFLIPITVFSSDGSSIGEQIYANGIVAETLRNPSAIPGGATAPGNITVWTPQGDIIANQGGIKQEALNGSAPVGPVVTLTAGTPAVPGVFNSSTPPIFVGNIDLGNVGAIGETVIAQYTGSITGLAVAKHNADITGQSAGSLTVLAGGTANVSVQSSGSGSGITIIGGAGVNASGIGAGATLLSQSVNGSAAQSTLGTSATATSASTSAAGQSSSQTQQQVASNDNGNDDEKKKKKAGLTRSVGRVTVILPKAS